MFSGVRGRRRQAAAGEEETSSSSAAPALAPSTSASGPQPLGKPLKPTNSAGKPASQVFSVSLPSLFAIQALVLVFLLLDPFGFRKHDVTKHKAESAAEPNKPLLNLADVERLAARVAIDGTVIVLICPAGYAEFAQNWLKVSEQLADMHLDNHFVIFAEDEDTYADLNSTFPSNVVLHMDIKDPKVDLAACPSPNTLTLAALRSAYRKVVYAREIMNTGKNLLLCDVTTALRRNPMPLFLHNDMYVTLGDASGNRGDELLGDFPAGLLLRLEAPLPRGVGKLPPLSDELLFLQNNVGSWVTLDYWAVVIEATLHKECNSQQYTQKGTDTYTNGASTSTFCRGVHNAVHLSPPPRIGLMPPAQFPPPTLYINDTSWRQLIENDTVVIRTKLGAKSKEQIQERLRALKLWKV